MVSDIYSPQNPSILSALRIGYILLGLQRLLDGVIGKDDHRLRHLTIHQVLIDQRGDKAAIHAAQRPDQMLDQGKQDGTLVRITDDSPRIP